MPFGIAQIGKSFRNEITPGNFTFRTREFEQMELEFFCKPGEELQWFDYWKQYCEQWLLSLGMKRENIRLRDHSEDELSHYSNATTDIEYKFPFGWGELWGIASRTDYDLRRHMEYSGEDFHYLDQETNERFIPYCIEPSLGADRVTLAFLIDAYEEEQLADGTTRTVMHLHPALAPYKVAVLPLSKSYQKVRVRSLNNFHNTLWSITTSPVRSENDIAVKMKLEHRSVLRMILIQNRTAWLPCATAIRWNKRAFQLRN